MKVKEIVLKSQTAASVKSIANPRIKVKGNSGKKIPMLFPQKQALKFVLHEFA